MNRVHVVSRTDPPKEQEAANALISLGADVVVSMTDTPTTVQTGESKGAWTIGYASDFRKFGPTPRKR